MNIVFFGTPEYVVCVLNKLNNSFRRKGGQNPIVSVVTQRPKPVGRKKIIKYSAVDKWAHKKSIPILYDPKELIENKVKADIGVLASYAKVIPQEVINIFAHGIINIHPSLLPEFKGSSPIKAAIVLGKGETGISFIKLDNLIDHGKIISQIKHPIRKNDTTESLINTLFTISSNEIVKLIPPYVKGKINLVEQKTKNSSTTYQLTKDDAFIPNKFFKDKFNFDKFKRKWEIKFIKVKGKAIKITPSPGSIHNFIKAMHPWPVAWTFIKTKKESPEEKRLKIIKSNLKKGKLVFEIVQLEGKNPVTWEEFKKGYPESGF